MALPNHPMFDKVKMLQARLKGLGSRFEKAGSDPATKMMHGRPNPRNKFNNMFNDRSVRAKSKGNKNL